MEDKNSDLKLISGGNAGKLSRDEKHDRLLEILNTLSNFEFTGYIKINFSQGGIGRVEKFEEVALNKNPRKR